MEAYVACCLIPLDKDPGIRPIGIEEVLRRMIDKIVVWQLKEDIKEAAGPLQTCAGHLAGVEATIHVMQTIFNDDTTGAILLIDAPNAFNCTNRSVALHNTYVICPVIDMYLIFIDTHLDFSYQESLKKSQEGTTQGPLTMPWFLLSTVPVKQSLRSQVPLVKQVWLADDASGEESYETYVNGII